MAADAHQTEPPDDERAVRSVPLDTEDGGQVVIEQENVGRQRMVGGGEFADPHAPITPEEADRRQRELDASTAPTATTPAGSTGRRLELPPLVEANGTTFPPDRVVGVMPVAICFTASVSSPVTREVVRSFDEHLADFGRSRVQALVVTADDPATIQAFRRELPGHAPVLSDPRGAWATVLHASRSPEDEPWAGGLGTVLPGDERGVAVTLLDAGGAVADQWEGAAGGVVAEEVLERMSRQGLLDVKPHR